MTAKAELGLLVLAEKIADATAREVSLSNDGWRHIKSK